jgi:hypothetical protein
MVYSSGRASAARASDDPIGQIESPIVIVQIPTGLDLERQLGRAAGMLRADYGDQGRLLLIDPDGRRRVLTEGFSSAAEFDVSFDGRRILFAAKRKPQDLWNIWEIGANGSNARQITRGLGNCRSPAYQATFYTIVSPKPWYQVMFVSDAAGDMNEFGSGAATSLYSCRLDGSGVRRLTMNLSDDLDPYLMDDGRVLLASWQRMDLRRGRFGRVALFGVNTDGTDYALFCGDQGRRIKHLPCLTTDGLVVFVEADAVGWDGAGQLGSVTLRRHFYSYRPVTRDPATLYHSPSPLEDDSVLVSGRPADGSGSHAVYRLNPRTGQKQLIFDDPQFHDMHAKVLAPRRQPDGRSSVVNEDYSTGKLYCLNAYVTDPPIIPQMRPGMIRGLRVIEGVPEAVGAREGNPRAGGRTATGGSGLKSFGIATVVQKRLLGRVPVEKDGSFHLELPADVPIQLQTLDAEGMALWTCGWIWVKHREARGCIGCHEDPELTPENRFAEALQQEGRKLTPPAEERRTVDFRRDLMPIIARKCASCHAGGEPVPDLRADPQGRFSRAYQSLLVAEPLPAGERPQADGPVAGRYVHPGQARTSPLIWRIVGRNTSRPWDGSYNPGETLPRCPPAGAEPLTDDEKLTFIEWIDLGAHWDGIPGPDEYSGAGQTTPGKETSK